MNQKTAVLSLDALREAIASRPPKRLHRKGYRPAAVLIPLFRTEEGWRVWLFRRTVDGSPHSGQVALPGGKPSAEDRSLLDTALREAREEIGVRREQVDVLGQLDDYLTLTGFCISPFVGVVSRDFDPVPCPGEVEHIFSAPLELFAGPAQMHEVQWRGLKVPVPSYAVEGEIVWGATFSILKSLMERISRRAG